MAIWIIIITTIIFIIISGAIASGSVHPITANNLAAIPHGRNYFLVAALPSFSLFLDLEDLERKELLPFYFRPFSSLFLLFTHHEHICLLMMEVPGSF